MPTDPKVRDLTAIVFDRFTSQTDGSCRLLIVDVGNFFVIFNMKLRIIDNTIDTYSSDVAHKYSRRVYQQNSA